MNETPLLSISDVSKHFGGVTAVDRCSLELEGNRIYGLIGPNGSGKTTLFNLISGTLRLDRGSILYKGEKISGLRPYQIANKGISRTFQIIRVFPKMTALENMIVVSRGGNVKEDEQRACELLDFVQLGHLKHEYAGNLSYGQQKLLEFIRALMSDPELVLLDEPAAGVNRTLLKSLLDRIQELREKGKTIVIVEHDMKVVMNLCERIFVLDHGEKIAEGTPEEVKENERVIEAYFGK
ncbi:MAG: ABC transporter ATP-binding protein [Nitrospinota bacterium]